MSLIQRGSDNKPKELTIEQKQELVTAQIEQQAFKAHSTLVKTYQDLYDRVWENRLGLTPQQVFDGLGTQGVELFKLSHLLVTIVNSAQPGTIKLIQPYEYTINPDGTVTVGKPL